MYFIIITWGILAEPAIVTIPDTGDSMKFSTWHKADAYGKENLEFYEVVAIS